MIRQEVLSETKVALIFLYHIFDVKETSVQHKDNVNLDIVSVYFGSPRVYCPVKTKI